MDPASATAPPATTDRTTGPTSTAVAEYHHNVPSTRADTAPYLTRDRAISPDTHPRSPTAAAGTHTAGHVTATLR
jgi:hypothetical protein